MIVLLDCVDAYYQSGLCSIVFAAREEKEMTQAVGVLASCSCRAVIPYLAKTHVGPRNY